MKLCRFDLPDDPRPRAGIFHEGQIYETDGEAALGVHVPTAVRLLTPIGHAASLRLYDAWGSGGFAYGNAGAIAPPESEILFSETGFAGVDVFMAAVIGSLDRDVSYAKAEGLVLGFTTLLAWKAGGEGPKLYDPGFCLGPFVVTPEELDANARDSERGRVFALKAKLHLGDEVVVSLDVPEMGFTFAELIRSAARGCDLREGDIVAAGPIPGLSLEEPLRDGDVVIAVIEKLGALAGTARI